MKNLKSLLWFFYSPADEREAAVYQKAYHRAFSTLFLVLGIGFYFLVMEIGLGQTVPFLVLKCVIAGILLLAYLVGWSAVRKEELRLEYQQIPKLNALKHLGIVLLAIILSVASIFLVREHLLPSLEIIGPLSTIFVEAALVYWAWCMTKPMPMPSRIVASLLFSPGIIFYMHWKKKGFGRFLLAQITGILMYFVIIFVMMIPVVITSMTVITPYVVKTDHFEPEVMNLYPVIVNTSEQSADVGEYIVFRGEQDKTYVGKVTGKEGEKIVIDSSLGEREIVQKDIVGEFIPPTEEERKEWQPPMEEDSGFGATAH
ncbi:MAG: S26 family signal peptidase [Patescibacteria group bacterium]